MVTLHPPMSTLDSEIQQTLAAITHAWRSGHVTDMIPYLHPQIVMKLPKFSTSIAGRDKLIEGFQEFCANARVTQYNETDLQIDIVDRCGIASYRFDMVYERHNYREHSKGRDLWIFQKDVNSWVAVWRTMIELTEVRTYRQGHKGAA